MINIFQTYFKGGILYFLSSIFISLSSLLIAPLVINGIGIATYGVYVMYISSIPLIISILSFGLGFIAKRYMPSANSMKKIEELYIPQFYIRLLILLSFITVVFLSVYFLKREFINLENLAFFFFPVFYFFYEQIFDFYRFTHKLATSSLMGFLYNLLIVLLIYISIYTGYANNLNDLIAIHLICVLPLILFYFPQVFLKISFKPIIYKKFSDFKNDINLGLPLVLNNFNETLINIGDRYLIGFIVSAAAVGFYSPSYAIGCFLIILARISTGVLPPILSNLYDNNDLASFRNILSLALKFYFSLSFAFFIGANVYGDEFLAIYINPEFSENSSVILYLISFATIFAGMNLVLSNYFYVLLKTKFMLNVNALAVVINIMLNCILLYIFKDILYAAISTILSFLIVFLIYFSYTRAFLNIRFNYFSIIRTLIPPLSILFISLILEYSFFNSLSIFIKIITCMLGYIFIIIFVEIDFFRELMKKIN